MDSRTEKLYIDFINNSENKWFFFSIGVGTLVDILGETIIENFELVTENYPDYVFKNLSIDLSTEDLYCKVNQNAVDRDYKELMIHVVKTTEYTPFHQIENPERLLNPAFKVNKLKVNKLYDLFSYAIWNGDFDYDFDFEKYIILE